MKFYLEREKEKYDLEIINYWVNIVYLFFCVSKFYKNRVIIFDKSFEILYNRGEIYIC